MKLRVATLSAICSFIFLTVGANAQKQLQIRQQIVPLKSTKADVEKLARFVKESGYYSEYETDNERLEVVYTAKRCERNGWNVPEDRVLYFRVYPKTALPIEALNTGGFVRRTIDDIFTEARTDRVRGVQYVIRRNFPVVDYIRFVPTQADQVLRCKGFPIYDPVRSEYSPSVEVTVRPDSDWNEFRLGPAVDATMMRLREPKLRNYMLVYASKGHFREARAVMDKLNQIAHHLKKEERRRLKIQFGGYRDETEIEAFLLWNSEPPPIPTPTYPTIRRR